MKKMLEKFPFYRYAVIILTKLVNNFNDKILNNDSLLLSLYDTVVKCVKDHF